MIDLHTHILPGLDDGARTIADSVEIARAAAADGIHTLAATPHVRADYPTAPAAMEGAFRRLGAALLEEGIPIRVLPGGEIALDQLSRLAPAELVRFALGTSARYLLLEFPYHGWPLGLRDTVFRLETKGFVCVIAHPERNAEVQQNPARLRELLSERTLVQLTAASVDGRLGRGTRRAARALLALELAHLLASDAHLPDVRAIGMSAAKRSLADSRLAAWLTHDVPAAIVDGGEIPPRPRRSRWFRPGR